MYQVKIFDGPDDNSGIAIHSANINGEKLTSGTIKTGINKIDSFDFGVNMIAGTYIDIGNGSLFVEYTSRKFFDNNLISLGYRFAF